MARSPLETTYLAYIACLNARPLKDLDIYVREGAIHNGKGLSIADYEGMINESYNAIDNLHYDVQHLLVNEETQIVGARLMYSDVVIRGNFLDLRASAKKVSFSENVFYQFRDGKITEVWSVIDKVTLEEQLK